MINSTIPLAFINVIVILFPAKPVCDLNDFANFVKIWCSYSNGHERNCPPGHGTV